MKELSPHIISRSLVVVGLRVESCKAIADKIFYQNKKKTIEIERRNFRLKSKKKDNFINRLLRISEKSVKKQK